MRRLYSNDDVVRWSNSYGPAIEMVREKLAANLPQQKVDFYLSNLSGLCYMHGMNCVAQHDFDVAVTAFRESVAAICKMYERFENGQGRAMEAGNFQSLLVSFVTNDPNLISHLAGHYSADKGTPDSVYLGKVVKLLAMGDIDAARIALAQKRPRFEPQFIGYAECLEAIANKDHQRFISALDMATKSWHKWAAKAVKGLPDAVCFIHGAGLVRLAEQVLGHPIPIKSEHIPDELVR